MEGCAVITGILDYLFIGAIGVVAVSVAVYVANEHGMFDSEEKLSGRVMAAWSGAQRLVVKCSCIRSVISRGHQVWQRVAPGEKPGEYHRDLQDNLKALERVREDLVKAGKRGLRLSRGYLAEWDFEVSTKIVTTKTMFAFVRYCCGNCCFKEDGICALQERVGDPAQWSTE